MSPHGNFYGSGLVRLLPGDPSAPGLALVAGIAVEETVRALLPLPVTQSTPPQGERAIPGRLILKWPNDLLFDGAKLAGILLEREGDAVGIGIGVNLAHHPDLPDRHATSIAALAGTVPDPQDFAVMLAAAVARWVQRWRTEGLAPVCARWLERAHPIGTPLRVEGHGDGLFDGLDEVGALRLRLADGAVHVIQAGDVFLMQA